MSQVASELKEFHLFVGEQVDNGGSDLSPEECLQLWRVQNPSPSELRESVEAVKESLVDMEAGEPPIPFDECVNQLREKATFNEKHQ